MIQVESLDPKGWKLAEAEKRGKIQVCLAAADDRMLGMALVDPNGSMAPNELGYDGRVYEFSFGAGGTYIYHEQEQKTLAPESPR